MLVAMIAVVGVMTEMLGRLDVALSPKVQADVTKRVELREKQVSEATGELESTSARLKVQQEKLGATAPANVQADHRDTDAAMKDRGSAVQTKNGTTEQMIIQQEIRDLEAERDKIQRTLTKIKEADRGPGPVSETLTSSGIPRPVAAVIALAHRAIIAVPRENTISYSIWATGSPAMGAGWITDLSGLRPGSQNQLSNELSAANSGGSLGNSPLGLATDIYYNWGWPGVAVVPLFYALVFILLDLVLVGSGSPLLFAAKIFLFFSVPLMYSPFMFVLYGGAVVIALAGYVFLLRRGAFSFMGLRP
jgi:hypothetical protein